MRQANLCMLLVSLAVFANCGPAGASQQEPRPDTLAAFLQQLDQRIPALMERYDVPGTIVALITEGEVSWAQAYGYAERASKRKMTVDTYCRVESISKTVTAWGVMKLVETGKIKLDDPVDQYLKGWEFPTSDYPTEQITVRQLLSHSSGLPLGTVGIHYPPQADKPSLEEKLARDAILQQAPGKSFSYSNAGFNVLELLIEEVSGQSFADYMQSAVLAPLGMQHSSFEWRESFEPTVPHGHGHDSKPIPVYVYPDKASGGLFSTVGDVATFVAAGMKKYNEPAVLTASSIDSLYTPAASVGGFYGLVFDAYGLGYFLEWLDDGKQAVSHGGQGSGWMTHFHAVPETGDGIVILSNSQRSWPFFSYVLMEWAAWAGIAPVGMSLIKEATDWLWAIVGLLFLLSIGLIGRWGSGMIKRRRKMQSGFTAIRIVQLLLAAAIAYLLLWSINQEYLIISSIFPIASVWMGIVLASLTLALLLLVLFPKIKN